MMATESPVRMVESTNWPSSKGVATFSSKINNIAADELEVLLKTHKYHGDNRNTTPNRSGSAPPTIEGSFSAYGNLMAQKNSNIKSSFINSGNSLENSESEEQMRADPAYFEYYYSNVNLNPRLPPPIVSRENNRGNIGNIGNNWRLTSYDDSGSGSFHFARDSLSPHKEETEDEKSDNCSDNGNLIIPGYEAAYSDARHKSLVDLIQEDFPRTPSPLYNLSHSSSHATTADERINHDVQSISLENLSLSASKHTDPNLDLSNNDNITNTPPSPQDIQPRNEYIEPGNKTVMLSGTTQPDLFLSQQQINNEKHLLSHRHTTFSQLQQATEESSQQQHHFLQHPGLTPPLYATATAYMTSGNLPFYPGSSNLPPGYAAAPPPQYGGYALNPAFFPQFLSEYPTANINMHYAAAAAATSFSSGEIIPNTGNEFLQQQGNKFYMQTSFPDPIQTQLQMQMQMQNMQYFQQQYSGQAFRGPDNNYGSFSQEKQANIASGGYYGTQPMGQFRVSPYSSPLFPSSPVAAGLNNPEKRNDFRFSQGGSSRNMGIYSLNEPQKKHSILEELKSCSARKIDLSDFSGRFVEFSVDQHGSRFIQQKLENCGDEEKESVFREILPHASKLMTDVFGNYVIQKFFEHGSREQRKQLANLLKGQILPLTFQMYGCRVIQKALEVIEIDQKTELVHELDGHVLRCVRDQNGNHVIQKCIESIPTEKIGFIISSFQGEVANLSTHPYGCRVIQRVLEHCGNDFQSQCIIDEILDSAHILAQDQYGNYVAQHVLERGKSHERSQIISKLSGRIVQMSQHKYASNVVEKCLEYGDMAERERLIEEILGISNENNNLLIMMKDQFANYVVQKILEISNGKQREVLLNRIKINLQALKKYTYGKHIVARFEQLCGEEAEMSSP